MFTKPSKCFSQMFDMFVKRTRIHKHVIKVGTENGTVILFSSPEFERRNSMGVRQMYLISIPLAALRSNF